MAVFHRKLFSFLPSPSPSLSSPCPDFCDPSCGDFQDCYLLPDSNLNPPDPSPSPPSPDHQVFHIPTVAILVIIALASFFLLVSYWAAFTRWTRLATRRDPDPPQSDHLDNDDDHSLDLDGGDHLVDHPIWFITTVGLQQSVIDSITMIKYKKGDRLIEGSDCSVCLSEFQEGESLRILPKCSHAFHVGCIDTWLRSHTNCPLCRAGIVVDPGGPSLGPNDPSFGHSRRTGLTEMVDSGPNEVDSGPNVTGESNSVITEHRADMGECSELQVTRPVSIDFQPGQNSENMDGPSLVRNPKWSSFRMIGSCSFSSSWRALGSSRQVKRSYSWSERVFGSARCQKRSSDPQSSSSSDAA